jgi:bifunctional non-homologous end joining protein LigD
LKTTKDRAAANYLRFIEPMKATLVKEPPLRGTWHYELKFDGYRAMALKSGSVVQLLSRNEKDFAKRFPEIVDAVAALRVGDLIMDGEIVALDSEGRPSFRLLQAREAGPHRPPIAFYAFDLLRAHGNDLTQVALHQRRETLRALLKTAEDPIRYSATIEGDPKDLLEEVRRRGLEGLIGKERESIYEIGRRSSSWVKLKCAHEQEFVIGGFTAPEGTRQCFGALLVGVFEKSKLRFCGKVGTGFDGNLLRSIYDRMRALSTTECPFADLTGLARGRGKLNIGPSELKRCHWIKPHLVCQVRFTEWTDDGKLRHPVFVGLREDKEAPQVLRERAV